MLDLVLGLVRGWGWGLWRWVSGLNLLEVLAAEFVAASVSHNFSS